MSPRLAVRVSMVDGSTVKRELMVDGYKVAEFKNRAELIDFIMQAVSALRYEPDAKW